MATAKKKPQEPETGTRVYVIDGERYTFEWDVFMGSEASFVQRVLGLEIAQWQKGLEESNYDCILALVALMKHRKDPKNVSLRNVDLDDFDFNLATFEVITEPKQVAAAEDPTPAGASDSSASDPQAAA